ncbi:MAG: M90 family metallopeptidase, partial [Ilumatobacteraceae bacterium]
MSWRRNRRRREALDEPFPDAWRPRLAYRWPVWGSLDADERERLEHLIKLFLVDVRFEAAQGFSIDDDKRLLVAAQASLISLELPDDVYRSVTSVILHPRTVVLHGARHVGAGSVVSDAPMPISGQAHIKGPVVLAWSTVAYEARHPEQGQNVVYHEFAHQLDMLDSNIDGTPPIADATRRARWVEVCTAEMRSLRRGDEHVLREYAATDPGEFFAVATETFFTRPGAVRD